MENQQEVYGTLASGGSFRVSPALLEVRTPTGEVAATFDTRFFNSVERDGQTITIGRVGNSSINVTASTAQEAESLERVLRGAIPVPGGAVPVPAEAGGAGSSILKWGCIGTLAFVGLAAICLIAGLFLFRDDDDDDGANVAAIATATMTVLATVEPTATTISSSSSAEATAPAEPTSDEEPTATQVVVQPLSSPTVSSEATAIAEPEPTATSAAETTVTVEPERSGVGMSRSDPFPFGETASFDDWDIEILEVIRGQDAFDMLLEVNQFNGPPPPGHEYLLVNLFARYTGDDSDGPVDIGILWVSATGSSRVLHQRPFVLEPEPAFNASLSSGGETTGWVPFVVHEGETDLMLHFQDWLVWEVEPVYLALEPGASIEPVTGPLAEVNDLGNERGNPAPFGAQVVTDEWMLQVLEVYRGQEALDRLLEANEFYPEPSAGMEYVLVYASAGNNTTVVDVRWISMFAFGITGSSNQVFDTVFAVDPEPILDFDLFAGGEAAGWLTFEVPLDEQDLTLIFEDWQHFTQPTRYLALE